MRSILTIKQRCRMKSKIPGMSLDLKVPLPSCGYTRTGIQGNNRWRGAVTSTSSINDATVPGTYNCQEWDHIESLDTCTGWSVERSKTKCEMWGAATLLAGYTNCLFACLLHTRSAKLRRHLHNATSHLRPCVAILTLTPDDGQVDPLHATNVPCTNPQRWNRDHGKPKTHWYV